MASPTVSTLRSTPPPSPHMMNDHQIQQQLGNLVVTEREQTVSVLVPEIIREIYVPVEETVDLSAYHMEIAELETLLRNKEMMLADLQAQNHHTDGRLWNLADHNNMLLAAMSQHNGHINHLIQSTAIIEQSKVQPIVQTVFIENVITKPVIVESLVEQLVDRPVIIENIVEVPVESPVLIHVEKEIDTPVIVEQIVEKQVLIERETVVEQVIQRPVEFPRFVEVLIPRDIPKEVYIEQEVQVPVDVPVIVEVPRHVDREVYYEQVSEVFVDVPVEIEQPVIYEVNTPVDIPIIYESVIPRDVPVEIPVIYESIVEQVVEYPVFHDVVVPRPVPVDVIYESVVPVEIDVPVFVDNPIPVPVMIEQDVIHPVVVDVPVIVSTTVVERPIYIEKVITHIPTPPSPRLTPLPHLLPIIPELLPGIIPPPMPMMPLLSPRSDITVIEGAYDNSPPAGGNQEGLRRSVGLPKILKKSNEFKLRAQQIQSEVKPDQNHPEFAPLSDSIYYDEKNDPRQSENMSPKTPHWVGK